MDFSQWFSDQMKQRGWSQTYLATKAGVSRPLVNRIQNGDVLPSADFCIKVAGALGESPVKLLRIAGKLPPGAPNDQTITEIMDLLETMPQPQRIEVLKYIRYLKQGP
jgi:transcriptional regulator with XRE-family HTH domain